MDTTPFFLLAILLTFLGTITSLIIALITLNQKRTSNWAFIITGIFGFWMILSIIFFIGHVLRKSIQKERLIFEGLKKHNEDRRDYLILENDTAEQIQLLHSYLPDSLKNKVPAIFYTYFGDDELKRYPLVYPYSLNCFQNTNYGEIYDERNAYGITFTHQGVEQLPIAHISEFTFNPSLFLGKRGNIQTVNEKKYVIFHFHSVNVEEFESEKEMLERAKELGFVNPVNLMTIYDYEMLFY